MLRLPINNPFNYFDFSGIYLAYEDVLGNPYLGYTYIRRRYVIRIYIYTYNVGRQKDFQEKA